MMRVNLEDEFPGPPEPEPLDLRPPPLHRRLQHAPTSPVDVEVLDAPTTPCALQHLNDSAVDTFRCDDYYALKEVIADGLTEVCCGDHSHGLLHMCSRLGAWECLKVLLANGWEIDRRIRFHAGVTDSMLSLRGWCGTQRVDVLRSADGSMYLAWIGSTVLEQSLAAGNEQSMKTFFRLGADPGGELLAKFAANRGNEEERQIKIDWSMFESLLQRGRLDLARSIENPGWRGSSGLSTELEYRFCTMPVEAIDYVCSTRKIRQTMYTVCLMTERHHHDGVSYVLPRLVASGYLNGLPNVGLIRKQGLALLSHAIGHACQHTRNLVLDLLPELMLDGYGDRWRLPLHEAAQSPLDNAEDVQFLLDRGACPDAQSPGEGKPILGKRPFDHRIAYEYDRPRKYSFAVRGGDTALHITAKANVSLQTRLRRVSLLLDAGASPNIKNAKGNTPLHAHAVRAGFKGEEFALMRRLLVAAGANPRRRNKAGYTADELRGRVEGIVRRDLYAGSGITVELEAPPTPRGMERVWWVVRRPLLGPLWWMTDLVMIW